MNQGQFEAITKRLDRLIELLEAQRPTIIAVPNDANAVELMEQLNPAPVAKKVAKMAKPVAKGK